MPTRPEWAEGMRMEPPPSLPMAKGTTRAATAAPTTVQMAMVFDPFAIISRCAASVSAVSPDCVISSPSARGSGMGSR